MAHLTLAKKIYFGICFNRFNFFYRNNFKIRNFLYFFQIYSLKNLVCIAIKNISRNSTNFINHILFFHHNFP
ncbi:MAG: hypothetical protein CO138_00455, partial [Candidatus Moranbacteria bacterium CG_4_9_14_3_um_filter_33_15]